MKLNINLILFESDGGICNIWHSKICTKPLLEQSTIETTEKSISIFLKDLVKLDLI